MNNLLPEFTALENVMMPGLIAGHKRGEMLARASALLGAVGLSQRKSTGQESFLVESNNASR
jgi:lipoprotein-releasing system ATP-binding protein